MLPEIPTPFQFRYLLSHSFPGFISALTWIIFIDILSGDKIIPEEITITGLVGLIGLAFLVGTILGIIIDGLHHVIIEGFIFDREIIFKKNILEIKELNESLSALLPNTDLKLNSMYFFKVLKDKAIETFEFLENTYCFSEFYANSAIALFFLSFVTPFYLYSRLNLTWMMSLSLALIPLIITYCCLYLSYYSYKDFQSIKFSVLCGYLDCASYIKLSAKPGNRNFELEAAIFDRESQTPLLKGDLKIFFRPTLGEITLINDGKTDEQGVARATLRSSKKGNSIVTASFRGSIPAVTHMRFQES